ncbi:ROK family protein [Desertivirga xinjiangensis]|uniref:ROK family protein n=1 Tax=Desertivirga xinjiangensis TaxID=539206 RepID=UPI00210DDB0D|nr:ROK family protein [Pedobacter xinjiangensis]
MNNEESNIVVAGADVGGSHITVALVGLTGKCLIEDTSVRKYVNSKGDAKEILESWLFVLRAVLEKGGGMINKLAFSMPGPFDYENGISYIKGLDKYEAIYGLNVREYLAAQLKLEPGNIIFRNDAEAFLHGEVFCGAGRNMGKVVGLTLGTGFGSAISNKGVTQDLNLGSEPFKDSIADDYFTTRWFIKRFHELNGIQVDNVKEMVDLIEYDGLNSSIFDEYCNNLALFMVPFLLKEQPEAIILGGNIAKASHLFLDKLKSCLRNFDLEPVFKIAELNEDAALIGAAASFEPVLL